MCSYSCHYPVYVLFHLPHILLSTSLPIILFFSYEHIIVHYSSCIIPIILESVYPHIKTLMYQRNEQVNAICMVCSIDSAGRSADDFT